MIKYLNAFWFLKSIEKYCWYSRLLDIGLGILSGIIISSFVFMTFNWLGFRLLVLGVILMYTPNVITYFKGALK